MGTSSDPGGMDSPDAGCMSPYKNAALEKQREHSPFTKYRRQMDAQDQQAVAKLAEMEAKLKEMQEKLKVISLCYKHVDLQKGKIQDICFIKVYKLFMNFQLWLGFRACLALRSTSLIGSGGSASASCAESCG